MRHLLRSMVFALALVTLIASSHAYGDSLRCPGVAIGGAASATEATEITSLWFDLGDGVNGSDGPLGCPIEAAAIVTDAGWTGIEQKFQRGVILIGRDGSMGRKLAAVRGLNSWTVWWDGMEAFATASDSAPMLPAKELARIIHRGWQA